MIGVRVYQILKNSKAKKEFLKKVFERELFGQFLPPYLLEGFWDYRDLRKLWASVLAEKVMEAYEAKRPLLREGERFSTSPAYTTEILSIDYAVRKALFGEEFKDGITYTLNYFFHSSPMRGSALVVSIEPYKSLGEKATKAFMPHEYKNLFFDLAILTEGTLTASITFKPNVPIETTEVVVNDKKKYFRVEKAFKKLEDLLKGGV